MKTLFVCAAIAVFQFAGAQTTKSIKGFSNLAISGSMEVTLVKSSENKVVITEGDEDDIKIGTVEGNLAISNESDGVELTIYYNSTIEVIAIAGGAEVNVKDNIKSKNLNVSVADGSEVNLKADADNVSIAAASGSEIHLSGKAKNFEVHVASGAELNADKFKTENSSAVVASGAEVSIYATEMVNATVASGAELNVYGNPKKVNDNTAPDGELNIMR